MLREILCCFSGRNSLKPEVSVTPAQIFARFYSDPRPGEVFFFHEVSAPIPIHPFASSQSQHFLLTPRFLLHSCKCCLKLSGFNPLSKATFLLCLTVNWWKDIEDAWNKGRAKPDRGRRDLILSITLKPVIL